MSTISVNGTVNNPDPIRTHNEPASPFTGDTLPGGMTSQLLVPGFKNTGNVPQTVTVAIANVAGFTLVGYGFADDSGHLSQSYTINPGFSANLRVNALTGNNAGDDTPYSFDLSINWS